MNLCIMYEVHILILATYRCVGPYWQSRCTAKSQPAAFKSYTTEPEKPLCKSFLFTSFGLFKYWYDCMPFVLSNIQDLQSGCETRNYNQIHTFEIPLKYSSSTMKDLNNPNNAAVSTTSRIEIIAALHNRMLQFCEYPTSYEYNTACQRLITTFPILKDIRGTGYVSQQLVVHDIYSGMIFN